MLMDHKVKILNIAQRESRTAAVSVADDLRVSMVRILQRSFGDVSQLSMDFTHGVGVLPGSAIFVDNEASGFIWGLHTWGIHSISSRSYGKVSDIPVSSIRSIL